MMLTKSINSSVEYIRSFIFKGHERTANAKKNILASFFIRGCSIAISLILVPLTINYVTPSQYGIWITLSSIVAWFSFFDIGFGNGLRNKFAEAIATGQKELARIYVSTTYAILSIIIGIVLILFLCINPFLKWSSILNAPPDTAAELSIVALIVFVFFCMQFVLQLITTIITADQKPAKAAFFNMLGNVFSLLIIFILTRTTKGNLIGLCFALNLAPVVVLLLSSLWFYNRDYKYYAPSLKYVRFPYAKNLMKLGLKFFIIQIAVLILYESSNIIIIQLFKDGPAQVTTYNIAYKYFGIIPMIFGIILAPFWSAYTEAFTKQDFDWIKTTISKLRLVWLLSVAVVFIMLLFSNTAYKLWVGSAVKVPFFVSAALALYVLINAWCSIHAQFLNGVGKIKLQLYSAIFGAIVNIPLALFLGKQLGIAGVVLSSCILGIISAIWSPIQYLKIINNRANGIWNA